MISLIACGSSSPTKTPDAKIKLIDSAPMIDAPPACSAAASYTNFTQQVAVAEGSDKQDNPPLYTQSDLWQGLLSSSPEVFLAIEIFGGGGATNTPNWPTAVGAKSGVDLATAPDAVALIGANINGSGQAQDLYFALSGTLNVTAAAAGSGGTFSGTATNLMLVHGDVGSNGFVAAADGCKSSIASVNFTATLMAPMGPQQAEGPAGGKLGIIRQSLHNRMR